MAKQKIMFFDTTLRDGEQSPGASMNVEKKARIARQLEKLGVDVIEAGFPIASPGDFQAVKEISGIIEKSEVCALARSLPKDIQSAAKAVEGAKKPRIHVFLATSPIHMQFKLCKSKGEVVKQAVDSVKLARQYCNNVEFSPEDASRTEKEFLFDIIERAIDAGASTINIPDTVGYAMPAEYGALIRKVRERVPNIENAVISCHCHNDLGLAVANSLEAVKNGARQVECTINGIGERAGNAALEEIVMALQTRKDFFQEFEHSINTREIINSSRMVSELSGLFVQRNKAIVGKNAFAHSAGIHQDGLIKKKSTYEIISPQEIGLEETELVLGKHSGKHAIKNRLESFGIKITEQEAEAIFPKFKAMADEKKEVSNEELLALAKGIKSLI
ncbi:MAG: 2-isopropylmalate synthase [Candidatus Diapherotrites archaeon]|nr:2-isopropylmalate synthase [Candidatus Diapherotrites archaeon]